MAQDPIMAKALGRADELWEKSYEDYLVEDILLNRFIEQTFRENVDFRFFKEGASPSLLKPGAEKIRIFKGWHLDTFTNIERTPKGNVACVVGRGEVYQWLLPHPSVEVGPKDPFRLVRGTGVAGYVPKTKGAPDFCLNAAVKMCGKRAGVDGTINAAGLSGRYSQDKVRDDDEMDEHEDKPREEKVKPPTASERQVAWDDYLKSLPQPVQDDIQRMRDGITGAEDMEQLQAAGTLIKELTEKHDDQTITRKVRAAYSAQARKLKQKE